MERIREKHTGILGQSEIIFVINSTIELQKLSTGLKIAQNGYLFILCKYLKSSYYYKT